MGKAQRNFLRTENLKMVIKETGGDLYWVENGMLPWEEERTSRRKCSGKGGKGEVMASKPLSG